MSATTQCGIECQLQRSKSTKKIYSVKKVRKTMLSFPWVTILRRKHVQRPEERVVAGFLGCSLSENQSSLSFFVCLR